MSSGYEQICSQKLWMYARARVAEEHYFEDFNQENLCTGCRALPDDWNPSLKKGVSLPKRDPIDYDRGGVHLIGGRAVDVFRVNSSDSVDLEKISDSIFICIFKNIIDMELSTENSYSCEVCGRPWSTWYKDSLILETRTKFQNDRIYQSSVSFGGGPVRSKEVLFGDPVKALLEKEFPSLMFNERF